MEIYKQTYDLTSVVQTDTIVFFLGRLIKSNFPQPSLLLVLHTSMVACWYTKQFRLLLSMVAII